MRKKATTIWALLLCISCFFCGCGQNEENVQQGQKQDYSTSNETEEQETESYVKPEMKGEITISCFYEEEFLTAAAEQFMKLYPEVTVTINAYDGTFTCERFC